MKNKLELITEGTLHRIYSKEICLPSDYMEAFNAESREQLIETNTTLDKEVSKHILADLNKSRELISSAEGFLSKVEKITSNTNKAICSEDKNALKECVSDIDQLKLEIELIKSDLYTDDLTGLHNRRWIKEVYAEEDQFKESGTIVFLDLNRFKSVNDNYGHEVGDSLLKYFSKTVSHFFECRNIRFDFVRFAGDEFILFLYQNKKSAEIMVKQIQKEFESKKLTYRNKEVVDYKLSFSFGSRDFVNGDTLDSLMRASDLDMLNQKNKLYEGECRRK